MKTISNEGIVSTTHAILLLCRSKKSRIVDYAKIWGMKNGELLEIPDYALDVHTKRGKIKGRKYTFFKDVASKLENEVELNGEKFYKDFFNKYLEDLDAKIVTEKGYKENLEFNSIKEMNEYKNKQNTLF